MARPLPIKKIGPLEAIEIPGQPGGPCIVFFHGYGADASDLVPLANVLWAPPGTTWFFPNGPVKVPLSPHVYGRAWFPLDIEALEKTRMSGAQPDLSNFTPPGLKRIRQNVEEMLDNRSISMEQTILGGFSQGAMLATSVALHSSESPRGLFILSSNLINGKLWSEKAPSRKGLSFYQSHGTYDELLPMAGAQKLTDLLVKSGLKGRLQVFSGGHEIPQEVIHGLNNYLKTPFVGTEGKT